MNSQKIVVIDNYAKLSCCSGSLIINEENNETIIALSNIESLIISNTSVSLSAYLVNELMENSIRTIICDKTHKPYSLLLPLHGNVKAPLVSRIQEKWTKKRKDKLWKAIVEFKISNSIRTLKKNDRSVNPCLFQYAKEVKRADKTNREAIAAKLYFTDLFGADFTRESENGINAFLNYGYSILAAHISNILVAMGYNTESGIHHCSMYNMLNLTYDLIEPFRCFADQIAYEIRNEEGLTKEVKQKLVCVLEYECSYKRRKVYLREAIELFIRDCMRYLNEETETVDNIDV